ncbi:MAG: peptidoglycan D,D-transpeptidase FtsI family protein [Rubrobacteraceae bacterium]
MAVALVCLLLGGRAVYLSVASSDAVQALAAEQPAQEDPAAKDRGDILSADGRQLATSLQRYRLISTPYQIEDPEETASTLSNVVGDELGQNKEQIKAALTKQDSKGNLRGYSIVGSIEPQAAEKVRELEVEGLTLTPVPVRTYPDGQLASQTIGYLGDYGTAFGGIEARYQKKLESGQDVTLTVDAAVQQELEKELEGVVEEHKAKSALGVVMRVDDGAVVALAGVPSFDNNQFEKAEPELQRNRVLTDPYEPGSTFKPFTMAAALEERAVSTEDWFTVPDHMQVADRVIHDSEPHETKYMQPKDILEQSSNVGTIQVAQQLGGARLEDRIRSFGFGEATGIDFWGEDPGVVPAYEDWSGTSIGNIPIGQGLTVTPLQLVTGYASLINGGTAVEPHMLQKEGEPEQGKRMISRETSDIVRGMLENVVEKGSGHMAQIPGYTVGGKTGTSQKVDPETGAYAFKHIASFVGFAPASDPEYVALIVADEPQTDYWGEVVAAPAFQELMSFTLGYYNVPPDRKRPEDAKGENR